MQFNIDRDTHSGEDASGTYAVAVKGDRYGRLFELRFNGDIALEVWARRSERQPHAGDRHLATDPDVSSIIAWVVDNRAGTGLPLLTLEERVGDCTLGEVLRAFLLAYEAVFYPMLNRAAYPLKVECRGNQRFMMEERYGP